MNNVPPFERFSQDKSCATIRERGGKIFTVHKICIVPGIDWGDAESLFSNTSAYFLFIVYIHPGEMQFCTAFFQAVWWGWEN